MSKGKAIVKHGGRTGIVYSRTAPDYSFLYEASTVKNPEYSIGDRVVLPDGRVFRYAKCGYSLTDMKGAVYGYNKLVTEKDAIAVAAAIGAKYVDITFADTDGVANDGVITVDELRGGYISFYRGTDRQQRGIIGNTVRANGDTGNTRVYLDAALKVAILEDDNVEVLANPYSDVRGGAGGEQFGIWCSALGMPNVHATTGQYFWIQTWGIFRVSPTGAELGVNQGERMFVLGANGCVYSDRAYVDGGAPANHSYQPAGPLMARTDGDAGSAAPFINLMINP